LTAAICVSFYVIFNSLIEKTNKQALGDSWQGAIQHQVWSFLSGDGDKHAREATMYTVISLYFSFLLFDNSQ